MKIIITESQLAKINEIDFGGENETDNTPSKEQGNYFDTQLGVDDEFANKDFLFKVERAQKLGGILSIENTEPYNHYIQAGLTPIKLNYSMVYNKTMGEYEEDNRGIYITLPSNSDKLNYFRKYSSLEIREVVIFYPSTTLNENK